MTWGEGLAEVRAGRAALTPAVVAHGCATKRSIFKYQDTCQHGNELDPFGIFFGMVWGGASALRTSLTPSLLATSSPRRLTFHSNGTLTEPGGKPILLRGFTFDYKRGPHGGHSQTEVTDEDRRVSSLLPNTSFARLVMVHWHDEPTRQHGDCASDDHTLGFLNQPCLDQFDRVINWAAEGMWVTISARASLAAGDGGHGRTIFNNATLRKQMVSMWGFLARRYAGRDNIAGFEVMSEPRVDDASAIHAFHLSACDAVWGGDPAAGCFVGPGKFYDRTHLSSAYLIADPRVVYAANMFDYVEGTNGGEVRATLLRKLGMISNFSTTFSVPVWIDQWGVKDDSPGGVVAHATYLREILQIFGETRFHWSCEHAHASPTPPIVFRPLPMPQAP